MLGGGGGGAAYRPWANMLQSHQQEKHLVPHYHTPYHRWYRAGEQSAHAHDTQDELKWEEAL